jgi:predicted DNA-binding ribbon-helix-helix protein
MPKKVIKSISMDDSFYNKIAKHAKKRHMSTSGWLAAAAEEKLEREARLEEKAEGEYGRKKR